YGHKIKLHVKRMINGKTNGAKLIMMDTRLSNTATHADHYIAPYPGSEAAILLSIANYLIQNNLYNREFVRRWWNWEEFLEQGSEVGDRRSEVGDQRSEQPRSGEMFIETESPNSDTDSDQSAESINLARLRRDEVSDK